MNILASSIINNIEFMTLKLLFTKLSIINLNFFFFKFLWSHIAWGKSKFAITIYS